MSRLVDPRVCPDCRAPLDARARCTGCGLTLAGPDADRLWQTMQLADRLIESLRAAGRTAPAAEPGGTQPEPGPRIGTPPSAAPFPQAPFPQAPFPQARKLPLVSVPMVLLALGGLLLVVAAIVFVAVAWGSLGLAAKTLILVAVTGAVASVADLLTRHDLRAGAETLWLLTTVLLGLDVVAAHGADLAGFGAVSGRHLVGILGGVLLLAAVLIGLEVARSPLERIWSTLAPGVLGAFLLALAEAWTADQRVADAIAVPVLAGLVFLVAGLGGGRLRRLAHGLSGVAVVSWLVLLGVGFDRLASAPDDAAWWHGLDGWPLVVAAGYATLIALPARLPEWLRTAGASAALVPAVALAAGPSTTARADLLTLAGISAGLALVAGLAPSPWRLPGAALAGLAGAVAAGVTLARPWVLAADWPGPGAGAFDRALPEPATAIGAATPVLLALAVGACGFGLLPQIREWFGPRTAAAVGRSLIALGPGAVGLGIADRLLADRPDLYAAVVVWTALTAVSYAMASSVRAHTAPVLATTVLSGFLVLTGLRLAAPSWLLLASFATVFAVPTVLTHLAAGTRATPAARVLSVVGAAGGTALALIAVAAWLRTADLDRDPTAVGLAVAAAAALLGARAARTPASRIGTEVVALLSGLLAPLTASSLGAGVHALTVTGTGLALLALTCADRRAAATVALLPLGLAGALRAGNDLGAPELSTLPAAVLLLGVGAFRLTRDRELPSVGQLADGLSLALVPSLLMAWHDPVSLRGALLGAGTLAVLGTGILRRWSAPFLAGGTVAALLAVRHLGPYAEALPRWIVLAAIGSALLLLGVSWERRLREVRRAGQYLRGLR